MFKRFIVVFLSLSLIFVPCLTFSVSASGLDSSASDYKLDLTPYLVNSYITLSGTNSYTISFHPVDPVSFDYIDLVFETDSQNFRVFTWWEYLTVVKIDDSLYRAFGGLPITSPQSSVDFYLSNSDSSATYFNILTSYVYADDYISSDIPLNYSLSGSYTYKYYLNNDPDRQYIPQSDSFNISSSVSVPGAINTPLLHPNDGNYNFNSDWVLNEQDVFMTSLLSFDWTPFDRVDIYLFNNFTDLTDYAFYVDNINVLSSIQSVSINNQSGTIISLDFSDLNPSVNSSNCVMRFRGSRLLSSSTSFQLFYIHQLNGFTKIVSNNFWPSWLQQILDKFNLIINPDAPATDSAIQNAQDNIANIEQIESEYAADLDSSVVTGQVDKVQNYGNALVFCSSILSRSFNNLGGYQIIYILPVCIGIFLFVASRARPIHVPKQREAPKANDNSVLDNSSG